MTNPSNTDIFGFGVATASTTAKPKALTREMVQDIIKSMPKPEPMLALNPHVHMPVSNDLSLADLKNLGQLPPNIMLSKAVPLLTGYEFDRSILNLTMFEREQS